MTHNRPKRLFRLLIVPLLVLLPLLSVGCATDKAVIGQANQFHQGLEPAVITDASLSSYIQKVGDRIISAARDLDRQGFGPESHKKADSSWMFNGMQFHFVNSPTLNAFTTGGNHMYIYTGLFLNCDTEDELAAVMSHEFAHVYCRHVQAGMNRQIITQVAAAGAGYAAGYAAGGKNQQSVASSASGLAALAGQYFGMSYTRADEDQADQIGFQFYAHAGWDPGKFADFFKKMIEKGYDKTPEMMSDHPSLANRVKATEERAAKLPPEASSWRRPPVADVQQFRQYQQRAQQVGKNMPTSESLANAQQLLQAMPRSCLTPRDQDPSLRDQHEAQLNIVNYLERKQQQSGRGRAQRAGYSRQQEPPERRGYN
jgi:predicted Zn-dependent protease